jgi:hypothetical protein
MHKHTAATSSLLLVGIIITTIMITAYIGIITNTTNPNQLAYAHNFVPTIAASFLTRINQIRVQTQLVENDIPLNLSLAKQHAEIASELFDNNIQNDLYYNAEGNNGLAQKVSYDIPLALNNLQKAVETISTKTTAPAPASSSSSIEQSQPLPPSSQQQQTTSSNTVIKQIKEMVNNIYDILDKAVSVRIDRYDLTNSTVHALVLADITEKTYNDYSYAYGIKPVIFSGSSSMMMNMDNGMDKRGMGMMTMGSSSPNASSNSNGSSTTNSSTMSHLPVTNDNNNNSSTVVNTTAYQQAQGLAVRAQEIFSNDLKPTSSVTGSLLSSANATSASTNSNSNITTASISKIESNLIQLKNAIESKAPVMDVMKIVHGDIHPTLLISYNLQLRR